MSSKRLVLGFLLTVASLEAAELPLDWSSAGTKIALSGTAPNPGGYTDYFFEILSADGSIRKTTLRSKPLTLEKAWLGPTGKLVALGRSGTQAAHLLIEESGQQANVWIRAWRNELSPSGRFLALEKFQAAHGFELPDAVTIYDLAKTPEENSLTDEPRSEYFEPRDCTGRIVYPEANAFRRTCQFESLDFNRRLSSPFLWSRGTDRETLFFLAQEENQLFLIRTTLPTPDAPAVLWRQLIDLEGMYHPEPNNDLNFKNGLKFFADKLSWTPEGRIQVELDPVYGFGSSFVLSPD